MNEQSKNMELLGTVPIPKALLALGLPTMIGMLISKTRRKPQSRHWYQEMLTLEKIAEYAGLPLDEVKKLKAERTA